MFVCWRGEGGKVVPPTIQMCKMSWLCGSISSLSLDVLPLNLYPLSHSLPLWRTPKNVCVGGYLLQCWWIFSYFQKTKGSIKVNKSAMSCCSFVGLYCCVYANVMNSARMQFLVSCYYGAESETSCYNQKYWFAIGWEYSQHGEGCHSEGICCLVTSFSCQNLLKSKNKKHDCLEYKVPPSCKYWAKTDEKCKSSSKVATFGILFAHCEKEKHQREVSFC